MNVYEWPAKGPDDKLDYEIDWSLALDGDTIATSVFAVSTGLTVVTSSNTTTKSIIWFNGGAVGQIYAIECTITTAGGRQFVRNITIKVDKNP